MPAMPDAMELLPLIEKPPRYPVLKKHAEGRVVQWVVATGPLFCLQPWYCEIAGVSRGRRIAKPPRDKDGLEEFGLDERDQVAVARKHITFRARGTPVSHLYSERFFIPDGDPIVEYEYGRDEWDKKAPKAVGRYRFKKGRLVDYACLTQPVRRTRFDNGHMVEEWKERVWRTESYAYEDERLTEVRARSSGDGAESRCLLHYEGGSLTAIVDATGRVRFRRFLPKLAELLKTMQESLLAQIPKVVAAFTVDEPVFCLALAYDAESEYELPPTLVLGLESDLRAWEAAGRKRELRSLWDPQQMRTFDHDRLECCGDARLRQVAAHFRKSGNYAPARKLLVEVSKALDKLQWEKITRATKHFVVYPVDLEGAHLKANIRAAVPAKALKALQTEHRNLLE